MRSPVNASPMPSRASAHELGVDAVRYSFIVMDLHHLLLAGLPAHSGLPPGADIVTAGRHVSKNYQEVTDAPQQASPLIGAEQEMLFNHAVGTEQSGGRDGKVQSLRRL